MDIDKAREADELEKHIKIYDGKDFLTASKINPYVDEDDRNFDDYYDSLNEQNEGERNG